MDTKKILVPDPQGNIVEEVCGEAREMLDTAADRTEAERIAREFCTRLKSRCESSLLVGAAREYLTDLIARRW